MRRVGRELGVGLHLSDNVTRLSPLFSAAFFWGGGGGVLVGSRGLGFT